MPAFKTSVSFSERSQQVLDGYSTRTDGGPALSSLVNEIMARYEWIIRSSLPALTDAEWRIILDAYGGSQLDYNKPFRVGSDIMNHHGWSLAEVARSEEPAALLAMKLSELSQAEQAAIVDAVSRFYFCDSDLSQGGLAQIVYSLYKSEGNKPMGFEATVTVTDGEHEESPRVVMEVSGHREFAGEWVVYDGTEHPLSGAIATAPGPGSLPPDFNDMEVKMARAMIEDAINKYEER